MSAGEMNISLTREKTHSRDGNEDDNSAAASSSVPITPEEFARQIKAATDPLTRQLEKLCELMKELCRDTAWRNEETYAQIQGPTGPHGETYDTCI